MQLRERLLDSTIAFVSSPAFTVPWCEPRDLQISLDDPTTDLGMGEIWLPPEDEPPVLVGFADGSIARLMDPILATPRRTLRERITPLVTPALLATSLVLLVLLGLFHMATRQTRIREQLRDEYQLVVHLGDDRQTWRAVPLPRARNHFTMKSAAIELLVHHGNVGELCLSGCNMLTTVPELAGLTSLKTLDLSQCGALTRVPELTGMTSLETLNLSGCHRLTAVPELTGLPSLEWLDLSDCDSLTTVSRLNGLTSLKKLFLSQCDALTKVPELTGLPSLERLDIINCDALTAVPELRGLTSLLWLDLSDCDALTKVPELTGLTSLEWLDLSDCDSLTTVPGLNGLTSLQKVFLSQCDALTKVPELTGLTSLEELNLSDCDALTTVPELTGLTSLKKLLLSQCAALTTVPEFTGLTSLEELDLGHCGALTTVPELSTDLSDILTIYVFRVPEPVVQKLRASGAKIIEAESAAVLKRFRSKPGPSCQNRKQVLPGRSRTVSCLTVSSRIAATAMSVNAIAIHITDGRHARERIAIAQRRIAVEVTGDLQRIRNVQRRPSRDREAVVLDLTVSGDTD